MFLKDESYSYESEIRVCIRIGHVSRLDKLRETMTGGDVPLIDDPNLSLPEQYALLIKRRLQVQPFLPTELAPRAYKVPIASGFLESVCIDPRAAAHKREFMESYFATNGVRIEKSKSFDAAYIELQAYPGLKT